MISVTDLSWNAKKYTCVIQSYDSVSRAPVAAKQVSQLATLEAVSLGSWETFSSGIGTPSLIGATTLSVWLSWLKQMSILMK